MSEETTTNSVPVADGTVHQDSSNAGLAGLRELIRAKQERISQQLIANNIDAAKSNNGENSSDINAQQNQLDWQNNDKQAKEEQDKAPLRLPFAGKDIIYGEILPGKEDVTAYVYQEGKLLVYKAQVYAERADDYVKIVRRMLKNTKNFASLASSNGKTKVFINKNAEIGLANEDISYRDEYKIVSGSSEAHNLAYQLVKSILEGNSESNSAKPVASKQKEDKIDIEAPADQSGDTKKAKIIEQPESSNKDSKQLIENITRIKEIIESAQQDYLTPKQAMEVFLIVGQASTKVLTQLIGVDNMVAELLIDEARRQHALGSPRADKTYPILIDNIDKIYNLDGANLDLDKRERDFQMAVKRMKVRGKIISYDLDEVMMVKLADQYIEAVANFVNDSNCSSLGKLWNSTEDEQIKLSKVLQVLSDDGAELARNQLEMHKFQQFVTEPILLAGWLTANPVNGYPWLEWQVDHTDNLKMNSLRWLLTNFDWLICQFEPIEIEALQAMVTNLRFDKITDVAERLRNQLIAKLQNAELPHTEMVNKDQICIDEVIVKKD